MNNYKNNNSQELIESRRKVLENGFPPLPLTEKRPAPTAWPYLEIDFLTIREWERDPQTHNKKTTGIRLGDGLVAIDIDVDHPIVAELNAVMEERFPNALCRGSGSYKTAWLLRGPEDFTHYVSQYWYPPGASEDDGHHFIEILSRTRGAKASPQQLAAFGPHTITDGVVTRIYEWLGFDDETTPRSPLNTPREDLPLLTKRELLGLMDAFKKVFESAEWQPVKTKFDPNSGGAQQYEIEPDQIIELQGYEKIAFKDLQDGNYTGYRCTRSFLNDGVKHTALQCIVGFGHAGACISVPGSGVVYWAKDNRPSAPEVLQKIQETSGTVIQSDRRETYQEPSPDPAEHHKHLIKNYAYISAGAGKVVPIHAVNPMAEAMFFNSFVHEQTPYAYYEEGNDKKKVNPSHKWLSDPERIDAHGVKMRPDKPIPLYEEDADGHTYINTFRKISHDAMGGDASLGLELIEWLLPDKAERHYFMCWLAYKWLHPEVRGPIVVMVSEPSGAGRDRLMALLRALFTPRYCRPVAFDELVRGTNNGYLEGTLMLTCSEGAMPADTSVWKSRHAAAEAIKEDFTPEASTRMVKDKYIVAHDVMVYASLFMATNNRDAIPLVKDDRRFAVLANSGPLLREYDLTFFDRYSAWVKIPANIGAFAHHLDRYDIRDYSPFATPIDTAAKRDATELNQSALDDAITEVIESIEAIPCELSTVDFIVSSVTLMLTARRETVPTSIKNQVRLRTYKLRRNGKPWRVKFPDGSNHQPVAFNQEACKKMSKSYSKRVIEVLKLSKIGSENQTGPNLKIV